MTLHALVLASLLLLSHATADKYDLGEEPASTDGPTSTPPETQPAITQKPSSTDASFVTPNSDHSDSQFPLETATEEDLLRPCPRGHCGVVNFVPNFYAIVVEILKVPAKMLELLKIVWASVYEQLVLRITNGQASTLNLETILQKIASLKRLSVKLDLPNVKFLNMVRPGTLLHAWTRNLRALFKFPLGSLLRFVGAQVPEDQIEALRAVATLLADVLSHTANVIRSLHDGHSTISVVKKLLPIFNIFGIPSSLGDLLRWLQFVPHIGKQPTYNFDGTLPTNSNSFNWKGPMWSWNPQPFGVYPQNPFWEPYWKNPSTGGYRSRVKPGGAKSTTAKPTIDESKAPYIRDRPTSPKDACDKPHSQWTLPQAMYQIFKELFPHGLSTTKSDTWSGFDEAPTKIKPSNSSWLPGSPFPGHSVESFIPRTEPSSYTLPQSYLYTEKPIRGAPRPWYYPQGTIPNYGFDPILGRPNNNWNVFRPPYLSTSSHWVPPNFPVPFPGPYQIGDLYGTNWNTPFLNRPDQRAPILPTKRDNLWSLLIPKKKSTTAFPYRQRYFDRFADPYPGKQPGTLGTKKSKILNDGGSQPETKENECNQKYNNANKKSNLDFPVINRN